MALLNNVVFVVAAAGVGTFSVAGNVQGYQTPAAAGATDGLPYRYRAQSADLTQWEEGNTVSASSGTSFARTVTASSAGGTTIVSFTAAPTVALVAAAQDFLWFDAASALTPKQQDQAQQNLGIPAIMRDYIAGLTLSAVGSNQNFGISGGVATDSTNVDVMSFVGSYTKTGSAWSVGNGGGTLDTGTIAASTWYHAHLIKRLDTGVVDVLTSLSATSPTLPTSYTVFRRIGAMKTDTSSNWVKFSQYNRRFLWGTPVADVSNYALTSAGATLTLSVPPGVKVDAILGADFTNSANAQALALLYSPDTATQAAGTPAGNWTLTNPVAGIYCANQVTVRTNTSAQINAVADGSSGNSLFIITLGWDDPLGTNL